MQKIPHSFQLDHYIFNTSLRKYFFLTTKVFIAKSRGSKNVVKPSSFCWQLTKIGAQIFIANTSRQKELTKLADLLLGNFCSAVLEDFPPSQVFLDEKVILFSIYWSTEDFNPLFRLSFMVIKAATGTQTSIFEELMDWLLLSFLECIVLLR